MIKQEYYTVSELSKENDMSSRNIRKIINTLKDKTSNSLLYKDKNNTWRVHHLLLPKFKRRRRKYKQYIAFTIDPSAIYSEKEILERFRELVLMLDDDNLELEIVIEKKAKNHRRHIHGYYRTLKKREIRRGLKFWFPEMSYHETKTYDMEGWKNYITKEGSNIITINKIKKK